MINFSNQYTINIKGGDVIRLKKGMTIQEVISLLGNPSKIEKCVNKSNEKLVFKLSSDLIVTVSTYTILFTRQQLVYVAKLN
jgi:hypothetical protein